MTIYITMPQSLLAVQFDSPYYELEKKHSAGEEIRQETQHYLYLGR
jgi:hypothetical protein